MSATAARRNGERSVAMAICPAARVTERRPVALGVFDQLVGFGDPDRATAGEGKYLKPLLRLVRLGLVRQQAGAMRYRRQHRSSTPQSIARTPVA